MSGAAYLTGEWLPHDDCQAEASAPGTAMTDSDVALVDQIQAGSPQAWEELISRAQRDRRVGTSRSAGSIDRAMARTRRLGQAPLYRAAGRARLAQQASRRSCRPERAAGGEFQIRLYCPAAVDPQAAVAAGG